MILELFTRFATSCPGNMPLGFPTWYKYLNGVNTDVLDYSYSPPVKIGSVCTPQLGSINDVWLIVAAAVEILLRVATLVAIGFIVWGGIQFVMSQGEPDKAKKARDTTINAVIGLVISVVAATVVSFAAGKFTTP